MAPSTTGHNLIQVLTAMRNYGIGVNAEERMEQPRMLLDCHKVRLFCSFLCAAAAAIAAATTTLLLPPLLPHRWPSLLLPATATAACILSLPPSLCAASHHSR